MKRVFLTLLCLLIVSVGGYKLWYYIKYPYSVPVSIGASVVSDLGDGPVEVILHKYNSTRKNKYQTTGESISFSFPSDMYYYGKNQDGGPQWKIGLKLDYYTLEAMEPQLRLTEKLIPDMTAYNQAHTELDTKKTIIQIYSGITGAGPNYGPVLNGRYNKSGQFCDLTIYNDGSYPIFSDPKYKDVYPFTEGEHFYPLITKEIQKLSMKEAIKVLKDQNGFYAYCDPAKSNLFCNAKTTFEGWDLKYQFPKAELCNWKETRTRIREFLSKYVVKRTPPRVTEDK